MTRLCPENKIKFAIICAGNHMISSAICRNKHEYIFQRSTKLHGSVRQVQFAVFELNYECTFIPNCNKHFFILIDHKKCRFLKQSVLQSVQKQKQLYQGTGTIFPTPSRAFFQKSGFFYFLLSLSSLCYASLPLVLL